jgi:hypothetical protein
MVRVCGLNDRLIGPFVIEDETIKDARARFDFGRDPARPERSGDRGLSERVPVRTAIEP